MAEFDNLYVTCFVMKEKKGDRKARFLLTVSYEANKVSLFDVLSQCFLPMHRTSVQSLHREQRRRPRQNKSACTSFAKRWCEPWMAWVCSKAYARRPSKAVIAVLRPGLGPISWSQPGLGLEADPSQMGLGWVFEHTRSFYVDPRYSVPS